jgi:hypothetical protein
MQKFYYLRYTFCLLKLLTFNEPKDFENEKKKFFV